MRNKANKQNKFMQIMVAPIRILCRARDFYIRKMADCAGRIGYDGMVVCPTAQVVHLPKSFSVKSSMTNDQDEDFRELLRVASRKNIESKMRQTNMQTGEMGRSYSVGVGKIGRIDEDEPCGFVENVSKAELLYPRSRSHVVKRNFVYI